MDWLYSCVFWGDDVFVGWFLNRGGSEIGFCGSLFWFCGIFDY